MFRPALIATLFLLLLASRPTAPHTQQQETSKKIYLSDVSCSTFASSLPKILVDAKRRIFSFSMPIYQCDRSVAETGKTDVHGIRQPSAISIQGKSYEKGIGIGTPFVLTYDLGGAYTFFSTIAGVDDADQQPENWVFEIYLDDVKAGSWPVAKDRAAEIRLETTGAQELVLVGAGRDKMMVDLADAYLTQTSAPSRPPVKPTNRRAMFEIDNHLIINSDVLLLGKTAKKIDAEKGPDESALSLGGYGRTTSSRGADMWAGIKDKGDRLRWQALIRRPGRYRVWLRVVSSLPGEGPTPRDYHLQIHGKILPCQRDSRTIVERMPGERFTGHRWGYIYSDIHLEYGLHDVEIENASGAWLAVNRVVLVREGPVATSLAPGQALKPLASPLAFLASPRWEPKKVIGQHFISADNPEPFAPAQELGLMFAPTLTGIGAQFANADEESIRRLLSSHLPFTIHARFNRPYESPVIDEETYELIRRLAGDRWLGFWTTEWSDCFMINYLQSSPEAKTVPKTRKEAYERVKAWYQQHAAKCYDDLLAMCATWPWDHYAGEWSGGSGFHDEPGISPGTQIRILFSRGAARQYGKVWHSYIAPGAHDAHSWIQNRYLVRNRPYDTRQNPEGGGSISWVKRMMYLTYMWGTSSLKNETPAYQTDMTPDGTIVLSPMGEIAAKFFEFAATHKNRGVAYTPVGIVLDHMHGWGGHPIYPDHYPPLTWGRLQPEPGDYMKDALFQLLYPGQFDELNEWNLLSPTPYGDIFDVMLSTARLEHLEAYPVLVLVGDVAADMSQELAYRLQTYVRQGGTLVVNVAQLAHPFPVDILGVRLTDKRGQADSAKCDLDGHQMKGGTFSFRVIELQGAKSIMSTSRNAPLVTRHKVGKGAVILTMVPFLLQENLNAVCFLPHLLEHVTSGLLPFRIAGDIEFVVNRNEDSWLITLINNRGVFKLPTEREIIDYHQIQRAYITLSYKPAKLTDWINGQSIGARKLNRQEWQLTVDIPPGDLRIVQLQD